jgi:Yip1 domain
MAAPDSQATPATPAAYTPVVTDLWRLVRAPFAPQGVFAEQQAKPTFWMPWVVLSVIFGVISAFMLPAAMKMVDIASQARGTAVPPTAIVITKVATIVGPAIGLMIGVLIGAAVLYVVLLATGSSARFFGLMCIEIFASTTIVLQSVITTFMIRMRGIDAIQSATDLQQSLGLDLLTSPEFNQAHRALAGILRGIGPFPIWSLVVCAFGLMALEKVPRSKAWTAAIVAFVIGLLISGGAAMLFGGRAAA